MTTDSATPTLATLVELHARVQRHICLTVFGHLTLPYAPLRLRFENVSHRGTRDARAALFADLAELLCADPDTLRRVVAQGATGVRAAGLVVVTDEDGTCRVIHASALSEAERSLLLKSSPHQEPAL